LEALLTTKVFLLAKTVLATLTFLSLWIIAMAAEMAPPTIIGALSAHDALFRAIVVLLLARLQTIVTRSSAIAMHATHVTRVFTTIMATMLLLLEILHALLHIVNSSLQSIRMFCLQALMYK
jgi:hypothetical protein